ncbi:hypothetical protein EWM64_g10422 [Hericium alpestre]|uniref:acireductone dioxygenase (Fe(2+)-requiring) n=1 Tax=Hericium alpestre TaxID=135208 RepID=A0A4Y9ZIE0_9AGAM|nr:hypothetical protein EWM64_g10422 [Hericium alpestre]
MEDWQSEIDIVAKEKNYKNRDVINITKEGLGDGTGKSFRFFMRSKHLHEDEEIRYILDGAGYFDIREHPTDNWIRMHVTPGDLLVVPAGIYHRFGLDELNRIMTMRLFKARLTFSALLFLLLTSLSGGTEVDTAPTQQCNGCEPPQS